MPASTVSNLRQPPGGVAALDPCSDRLIYAFGLKTGPNATGVMVKEVMDEIIWKLSAPD